jgi:hypothetical protein
VNPEHYHLEFYENTGGSMPVLEWLKKLESDDSVKHDAVVYGLQVILAREGAGVCGTDVGKNLGKGRYEFRLRHTREELQAKAEPHKARASLSPEPVKVLIRLFFAVYGDKIELLLGGYDKAADGSRTRQNSESGQARARLRAHQQQAERKAQRPGRRAETAAGPDRPEDRVPHRRSFLMWSRLRRTGAGRH